MNHGKDGYGSKTEYYFMMKQKPPPENIDQMYQPEGINNIETTSNLSQKLKSIKPSGVMINGLPPLNISGQRSPSIYQMNYDSSLPTPSTSRKLAAMKEHQDINALLSRVREHKRANIFAMPNIKYEQSQFAQAQTLNPMNIKGITRKRNSVQPSHRMSDGQF